MSETIESDAPPEVISETELTGTALVAAVTENPVMVLINPAKFDQFYTAIAAEVAAHAPDLETDKGRKAIASLAYKVVKTKTAIVAAADALTEEAREMIKTVNKSRNDISKRLDNLRDEAKRPLTEWEAAEELRAQRVAARIEWLVESAKVLADDTVASVRDRLAEVTAETIDPAVYGNSFDRAGLNRAATIDILTAAIARLEREEADRAELAELRRLKAERDEADAREEAAKAAEALRAYQEAQAIEAARIAAEDVERRQREAEEAEIARAAAEELRIANAAKEAAEAATRKAQAEAVEARRLADEKAAAKLAAIQAEHDKLIADQAAERQAHLAVIQAQEAEAQRERDAAAVRAEEDRKRQANIAHRSKIMRAAKEAVIEHAGLTEEAAKAVVQAVIAGLIPNMKVEF